MKRSRLQRCIAALAALMFAVCAALPVQAATQQELEQQLAALQQKLEEDRAALAAMKENTAEARKQKQLLEAQVSTLKEQIAVIAGSVAEVQGQIGQTEQAILDTQADIDRRQAELDAQWGAFRQRMAAMQEMRDSGTMSLLSAVSDLYQFLTFSEVIQDVSRKDTEVMDGIQTQLNELAQAKTDLEAQKTELEQQKTELERQRVALNAKQTELADALVQASDELLTAEQAQAQAQEQLDSDQMDYEAVFDQIQSLISSATAAGGNAELSFTGFICPLKSYKRVSSEYGYRTLNGVRKLHAGTDYSAPEGTPIYAAAAGYVCAAGWNSGGYGNYVLLYHGAMNDGRTYSTLYAHMVSTPVVTAGSYVAQGQLIGYVGNTGRSYGSHLHLELWQGSTQSNSVANKAARIDPRGYVPR